MLAFIYSVILVSICLYGITLYNAESKPEQLHLDPTEAKSYLMGKYMAIQQMPQGEERVLAHQFWLREYEALQRNILAQGYELTIELVDR